MEERLNAQSELHGIDGKICGDVVQQRGAIISDDWLISGNSYTKKYTEQWILTYYYY